MEKSPLLQVDSTLLQLMVLEHYYTCFSYVYVQLGSSSGIGAATAVQLAIQGYKLALCTKNSPADEAGLNETLNNCLNANLALTRDDV